MVVTISSFTQSVGRDNEAFVFLNHYLDICEAIEEGNADLLDHSDFTETDFPQEIPLPATPYLSLHDHEEIKEWVLAVSMDQKVDQVYKNLWHFMPFFCFLHQH